MPYSDLTLAILDRNALMLKRTLADFTDADMLVRPTPAANHACWMLGHLVASETRMLSIVSPQTPSLLPAGFAEQFTNAKSHVDDPAQLMDKEPLTALFDKVRAKTVEVARATSDADMAREVPSPFQPGSTTTVGFMLHMPALHATMHIGQMQVIRRVLGKPVLF